MSRGLPKLVQENLEKARHAVLAAIEVYNKPGPQFRTAHYLVLMIIGWTALLHAIFYRRKQNPWYRTGKGKRVRYQKVDGDYRHWDLAECVRQFYEDKNPPPRANLEFAVGLRNKIEHRSLPELDPALYGECQAMLMNFEDLIVREFGEKYALAESLAVSLQFSRAMPREKAKALRRLGSSRTKTVRGYIEEFRAKLPPETLTSTEYSFSVYLVPKVANRASAADISVEFVPYDASRPEEMDKLEKVTALIKERQIPVINKNFLKPGAVRKQVQENIPFTFNQSHHTACWQHFHARPHGNDVDPTRTDSRYCAFDQAHNDYCYTQAWVQLLSSQLQTAEQFREITGSEPTPKKAGKDSFAA